MNFTLSALIRNYCHVLALIFFHHRDTEDTENFLFLLIVKQAIYKKKYVSVLSVTLCCELFCFSLR